jgi:hypothetical protein
MTPRILEAPFVAPKILYKQPPSRRKRLAVRTAATLGGTVAFIGALHAPFARGLLMRIGGCPTASAHMTSVEMDSARRVAVASDRATEAASTRPALGFTLDTTSESDVRAWAAREHASCEDVHPGLMKCADVPARALGRAEVEGTIDELALGFDRRGRLVNLTTLRSHLSPDQASRSAKDIATSLYGSLGVATRSAGSFTTEHLQKPGAASLGSLSYRYRDYVADVTALNLPSEGLALREHYMSAND